MMSLKKNPDWIAALGLFIVGILIFAWHLRNPLLHFDDFAFIRTVLPVASVNLWKFLSSHTIGHFFPVTNLTLLLDYSICGEAGTCYHVSSLVFHILNGVLIFFLLKRVLKIHVLLSFVIALLFLSHPSNSETVYWMAARCNAVQLFFSLLTFLALAGYRERRSVALYLATLGCFILALLAKESAIALLPMIVLLWPWRRNSVGSQVVTLLPFAGCGVFLLYIMWLFKQMGIDHVNDFVSMPLGERLPLAARGLVFYLQRGIFTTESYAFYDVHSFKIEMWQYCVAALWIPLTILSWRQNKVLSVLALLWFFGSLVPILKIIPYGESSIVNDHYLYGPWISLGVILALAGQFLVSGGRVSPSILAAGISVAVLVQMYATFQIGYAWNSERALWAHTLENDPNCALALTSIAIEDLREGKASDAERNLTLALKQKPSFVPALLNMAIVLRNKREFEPALGFATKASEIYPGLPDVHEVLGSLYLDTGREEEAIKSFQTCVRAAGVRTSCSLVLAKIFIRKSDCDSARPNILAVRDFGGGTPEISQMLELCHIQ